MQVEVRQDDRTLITVLAGDWELEGGTPSFERLVDSRESGEPLQAVAFEAGELGRWDSSLLTFLYQGMNYCEDHGLEFRDDGLPENIAGLLALSRAVPEKVADYEAPRLSPMARFGTRALSALDGFLAANAFIGEVAASFTRLLRGRLSLRWRDLWLVVQSNGPGALPIVTLISFLVGLIIAFLGAVVLQRFGAGYYVSYLVGYGILREMGALMTGIIMAGRTGAAFAAELGSMKITEEIDAYETLGLSAVDHLVLPRVLGLFLMMPLLTIYSMFVGVTGGLLVR